MTPISRRSFLTGTLAAALAGPAWREALAAKVGKERGAAPPPAGGELLNGVPFLDEPDLVFDQVLGAGLSGRRYLDLATLKDGDTVTPAERFFIRTTTPARLDTRRYWTLSWGTAGHPPRDLPLKELLPLVKPQGVHLLESVENGKDSRWGLISTADWGGISFTDLFTQVGRPEGSAYLLATGNDSHITPHADPTGGASWIFKVDDLLAAGAFLATEMNGQPLADDHGYPLRLVVP
nr:molybdopterin-dependent oxidoreductase [Thermoanaerobaculia bacterium]